MVAMQVGGCRADSEEGDGVDSPRQKACGTAWTSVTCIDPTANVSMLKRIGLLAGSHPPKDSPIPLNPIGSGHVSRSSAYHLVRAI